MQDIPISEKIDAAIKNGEIPPEMVEEYKLIAPDDPRTKQFSDYMQKIMDRLIRGALKENYRNGDVPKLRFLIIEDEAPNAFMESEANPPIVLFSTGLIKLSENESELAAVLCHELGHDSFDNRLGKNFNGKAQELSADLRAPYLLRMANYPQSSLRTFMDKLPKQKRSDDVFKRIFSTVTSAHPDRDTRMSALAEVERMLVRGSLERGWGMGEQDPASIQDGPLPSQVQKLGALKTRLGPVGDFFNQQDFENATATRQISILRAAYDIFIIKNNPYFRSRTNEFLQSLTLFTRVNKYKVTDSKEFADFIDYVCFDKKSRYSTEIYGTLTYDEPLGNLKAIQKHIDNFCSAPTKEEANRAAKKLVTSYQRYFSLNPSIICHVNFTGFSFPKDLKKRLDAGEKITAPWQTHLSWLSEPVDVDILKALEIVGIGQVSKHVAQLVSEHKIEPSHNISCVRKLTSVHEYETGKSYRLIYKSDGTVTCRESYREDLDFDEIHSRESDQEKEELAYTNKIDWKDFRKDFREFCKKHAQYILGEPSYFDRSYPFAERFTKELAEYVKLGGESVNNDTKWLFKDFWPSLVEGHAAQVNEVADWKFQKQFALSASHPILAFAIRHKNVLQYGGIDFSVFRFFSHDASKELLDRKLFKQPLFEGIPATSIEAFFSATSELKINEAYDHLKFSDAFLIDAMLYETINFLRDSQNISLSDIHRFRTILGGSFVGFYAHKDLFIALREEINNKASTFLATHELPNSLDELIANYKLLSVGSMGAGGVNTFMESLISLSPSIGVKYQKAIRDKITSITEVDAQITALEKIIFNDSNLPKAIESNQFSYHDLKYKGNIDDPQFKQWVNHAYVLSTANYLARLPKDERTTAIEKLIEKLNTHTNEITTSLILEELLKKNAANIYKPSEYELTLLREAISDTSLKKANSLHIHFAATEVSLLELANEPHIQQNILDLLTEPYSDQNALSFLDLAKKKIFKDRPADLLAFEEITTDRSLLYQIEVLHKKFWNSPFELRSALIKQVIFPIRIENEPVAMKKGIQWALDTALPPEKAAQDTETQAARQIVQSYFEANDDPADKRFMAAAMVVANPPQTREAGSEISPAKGLSLVLSAIDPAGDKVKQAIESHPDTPDSIKEAFKDSKTMAKNPPRDVVLKWVKSSNEALQTDQKMIAVRRVLGAGSYGITVEGLRQDGQTIARTILYPNVRGKAENEFRILSKAVNILVKKDPRFEPVLDMVRQAEKSSIIETDMDMAAKQAKLASELYDGLRIKVNDVDFTFEAAPYVGHSKDHKDFLVMPGKHFNDLATEAKKTDDEAKKNHVKSLAKALLTVEVMALLRGGPFDHDRHGGQQRISGNHIGQFDFGAMSLEKMNARQKELVGTVFGKVISNFSPDKSIAQLIHESVKSVAKNQEDRDFLAAVERSILALGNFQSELEQPDMLQVLAAVVGSGQVDTDIRKHIEEQLNDTGKMMLTMLESQASTCGISIEKTSEKFKPSMTTEDDQDLADLSELDYIEGEYVSGQTIQKQQGIQTSTNKKKPKINDEQELESKPSNKLGVATGVAAALGASALAAAHASKGSKDKEDKANPFVKSEVEKKSSDLSGIAGISLATVGAAALLDGLAFRGKGLQSLGRVFSKDKLANPIIIQSASRTGMLNVSTALGAVATGISAALLLSSQSSSQDKPNRL
ncbi:MAG: M48 family metalloprotease [Pseudobdellovibrionaceae bacterium]